jgi:pyruvate kinase
MEALPHTTPAAEALSAEELADLSLALETLRTGIRNSSAHYASALERVHPMHRAGAHNLLHYLALRQQMPQALQERLSRVGLSSLGRCEPHVLMALERIIAMLDLARGKAIPAFDDARVVGFREGPALLEAHAAQLLGRARPGRRLRIVVTQPSEAAEDPNWAKRMLDAGMDIARINCAHDGPKAWTAMIRHIRAAAKSLDRHCPILMDLAGPKIRTGAFAGGANGVRCSRGDRIVLLRPELPLKKFDKRLGQARKTWSSEQKADEALAYQAAFHCSEAAIFKDLAEGRAVWFDDGKLGGRIERIDAIGAWIRLNKAPKKGHKLKPGKGINLPDSALHLPALSAKDRRDFAFVQQHADLVALSFVHRTEDIAELLALMEEGLVHKDRHTRKQPLGLLLKIETNSAVQDLPALLLEAMRWPSCGVMIARGDLAVESGFVRLPSMQEEILRYCEAAHCPSIWATQVLEQLAKHGLPSRAEVTDAANAIRAEAVMLNKGPNIDEAVELLDAILLRQQSYQTKKRHWIPPSSPMRMPETAAGIVEKP